MAPVARKKLDKAEFGRLFWVLILSYSFEFVRWHIEIPMLSYLKIPGFLTYGLLFWWLYKGDQKIIFQQKPLRYVAGFLLLMGISTLWAKHVSAFWVTYYLIVSFLSMILPTVYVIDSWLKLRTFFQYWVLIHLIVSVIVIKNGGVGSGSFLLDENDVSLCLGMGVSYAFYLLQVKSLTPRWRAICWIALFFMVAGVVVSFSRGGLLGLIVVGLGLLWLSKRKVRNAALSLMAGVVLGWGVLIMLPSGYLKDMESINDPTNSTRVERFRSWEIAWLMFLDHPILGVGTSQFSWNVEDYQKKTSYWVNESDTKNLHGREAHSLYFSLLPDLGVVGVLIFSALVGSMARILFSLRKQMRQFEVRLNKESVENSKVPALDGLRGCELLAKAMLIAMAAFFVSGAFISVLYYPHIWLLAGFVGALNKVFTALLKEADRSLAIV